MKTDRDWLLECVEYHKAQHKAWKKERLYRDKCNLGPPLTTEMERKHARWAEAIQWMIE